MSDKVLQRGELFPPKVVDTLINSVRGHSSLAVLSTQKPIEFNGQKEFTFTFDKEVDVVAEGGAKSTGGISITPQVIVPIKVEYGARVSDEFMIANEETQLNILQEFANGFAKKIARALDIMAIHGFNPRTNQASTVIGGNHFDAKVTQTVTATTDMNADIESAIALVNANEIQTTGVILSPKGKSDLAKLKKTDGTPQFPELEWGATPTELRGLKSSFNSTVSVGGSKDLALVGDFENFFKWGIAKNLPLTVIEYGNPDNDAELGDLKGRNQVYLRSEAFIGWGILDPKAFAIVKGK